MATNNQKKQTIPVVEDNLFCKGSVRPNVALITGITGQDGSYLAELLLSKGYEVHGIIRRCSTFSTSRIEHLYANLKTHEQGMMKLHYGDMTDSACLMRIISDVRPKEVYNLAAQSDVHISFSMGEYTADVDAVGVFRLLEAIRQCGLCEQVRFYQASTSEMFGNASESPQSEKTRFHPRSPYGAAKIYAYWITVNFREAYKMFACSGILFNHESPRRGENFVTRKISRSVAKIAAGLQDVIELGNLDAGRDWGHAEDYVRAMWLMLQHSKPDDYVVASGQSHTVRQFVEAAFKNIGVTLKWEGEGIDEVGKDQSTGIVRVKINPEFYRPTKMVNGKKVQDLLEGDCTKAKEVLGWTIEKDFDALVREMVMADMEKIKSNATDLYAEATT